MKRGLENGPIENNMTIMREPRRKKAHNMGPLIYYLLSESYTLKLEIEFRDTEGHLEENTLTHTLWLVVITLVIGC